MRIRFPASPGFFYKKIYVLAVYDNVNVVY